MLHRRARRFKCPSGLDKRVCKYVLRDVWGFEWDPQKTHSNVSPGPYLDFWANCVHNANDEALALDDSNVAIFLVKTIRENLNETVERLVTKVHEYYRRPTSPGHDVSIAQAWTATAFAIQLWLHVKPDASWRATPSPALTQLLQSGLPSATAPGLMTGGRLNKSFSLRDLSRVCGLSVVWTDEFGRHLELEGRNIHVFRHAALLPMLRNMPK